MLMEEDVDFYEILRYVSGEPVLYSSILNNDKLRSEFKSIDDITACIHKLIADGMIQSKIKISSQEGEDLELSITELGKIILRKQTSS